MNADQLTASLGRLDHVATAHQSLITDGVGAGMRVIDVRLWDGVEVQILPDHGFDLGATWFKGTPVSWVSRLGFSVPSSGHRTPGPWMAGWGGGLLTTCGLFNVGLPSEGASQHGDFHLQRADEIQIERTLAPDGQVTLTLGATIREGGARGPLFELRRVWTLRTGEASIELLDTTTNLGLETEPAPLLYHVNFGSPFWRPGAQLAGPGGEIVPRDADAEAAFGSWDQAPEPTPNDPERVFEHILPGASGGVPRNTPERDIPAAEWPRFTIDSPPAGVRACVSWDASTLPRVHQWVDPAATVNALAIEPCNCTVLGRGADRAKGRLPQLQPGECRTTRLRIDFETR